MRIGQRVLDLLEQQKKQGTDLAKFLGVGTSTVYGWKQENRNPSADLIIPLCEYFNVTTDHLLTGKETNLRVIENDNANIIKNEKENGKMKRIVNFNILVEGLYAYFANGYCSFIENRLGNQFTGIIASFTHAPKEIYILSEDTGIPKERIEKFIDIAKWKEYPDTTDYKRENRYCTNEMKIYECDYTYYDEFLAMMGVDECNDEAAINLLNELKREHEYLKIAEETKSYKTAFTPKAN